MRDVIRLACAVALAAFAPVLLAATNASVTPLAADLGELQLPIPGAFSASVTNTGTTDIVVGSITAYGQVIPFNDCFLDGELLLRPLRPGESCTVYFSIPAGRLGPGSTQVTITINGGELTFTPTVSWYGIPGFIEPAVPTGNIEIGEVPPNESRTLTRVVRNTTLQPLDVEVRLGTGDGPDCLNGTRVHDNSQYCTNQVDTIRDSFSLSDENCHPIPAFGSCVLTLRFAPRAAYFMTASFGARWIGGHDLIELTWTVRGQGIPVQTVRGTVLAVEYQATPLGSTQYFVTADANEKALLDSTPTAWVRTGRSFWVFPAGTPALGTTPNCRFYVPAGAAGLGHFFSASPAECDAVKALFSDVWIFETADALRTYLPDAMGNCPVGTTAVYRLYDNRPTANHRYTTDRELRDRMVSSLGWVAEGYGPAITAMCAPQ